MRIIKNNFISILLTIVVFGMVAFLTLPSLNKVELPDLNMSAMGSETVKARVQEIIEDGEIDLGGTVQRYQVARVALLEGKYQGITMEMDYGKRQVLSNNIYLKTDDNIPVTVGSLGLIAAVPLTTAIAILFVLRADSLGKWRQVLGPEGTGGSHSH
jgi:hypothetical protein